jgi:molybdenum cofactor guanylyltransferase
VERVPTEYAKVSLYGLVLVGGKSSRMGTEKALLHYAGKPQFQRAYELITRYCDGVFLSIHPDQAAVTEFAAFPQIIDTAAGVSGPMAGILSALRTNPHAAWLVVACDLPFLDETTMAHLVQNRNRRQIATAYRSPHDGLPEPLCAIYEPHGTAHLKAMAALNIDCPREALTRAKIPLLELVNPGALDNVNTPEEYRQAQARLAHSP